MILTGVSMLVVALDQLTKFWVLKSIPLNQSVPIWPDFFYFTYIQNRGTAFGFMSDMDSMIRVPFFITITIAAALIVYSYQRVVREENLMSRVALGLIWGGALGNLVDRLVYGKVIDFIDIRYDDFRWFVFNVADFFITIGLVYLFFDFVVKRKQKKIA
jgi:signal peptidase II